MAALTRAKKVARLGVMAIADAFPLKVKASTTLYGGGLVCTDATGYAVPGSVATTLRAAGVANATYNNASGASGDITADVRPGIFKFENHGADLVVQADVGNDCYIVDDQTVAKTNGTSTRSRAGKVISVESDGVFVQVGFGV